MTMNPRPERPPVAPEHQRDAAQRILADAQQARDVLRGRSGSPVGWALAHTFTYRRRLAWWLRRRRSSASS